ncbi:MULTISPECIES: dihydrofolate reductase family protein [Arthrobacter]|uniref:Dihydrofolate reductase family protein n=1 Tax=Arthrobacter caoxuetaonis TaxID=2886935 RepID=A0A9X1MDK4_9MICC|nr:MULTISPECIES: dihydrofolate reductase family protein [Arthrobacter]MCC3282663.1 dihydrofolate reductase family protein [Arthrobacter caoxuetaonis]MCC3297801.1 dihydrofolate reductase family protein [Arthrobacter caoxuetaonis]MCC9193657.1 dihydrofolate reductase family protein [Arthrobacter sp. zg-Y916]USQ56006.1 dihydrofolate reductase family protein [Arthrobacter caoxuetaonis]
MANVLIHATVTLDGYMADPDDGVDWMFDVDAGDEDTALVNRVVGEIGAVVGGANRARTVEDGEEPYGGLPGVPVYLMTHEAQEPVVKDGVKYTFVVDDIAGAVDMAMADAGDKTVSLLGGKISRQCLQRGLVDEIQLHVVPILLGAGISLFEGLNQRINLELVENASFGNGGVHLRYRVLR